MTSAAAGYLLVVRGALTLDLGLGRRLRPLRPALVSIAAPPDTVFDVIASPYLRKTPRAMQAKLNVLERGTDMAVAAHFTSVGGPLGARVTVTTVESIRFERPERVAFRLLRGPVPYLTETFELHETRDGTDLEYHGELGTDLWQFGSWWGVLVARSWERAVTDSISSICTEAERRAGIRAARR